MNTAVRRPITAVIVTYDAEDTIAECLSALPPDMSVVIVDNASRDATADVVRATRPSTRLVCHDHNAGFAAGVNAALAVVDRTHDVWLVNPDSAPAADAADRLAEFLADHPSAAAVSARVVDRNGAPERICGHRPDAVAVALHELGLGRIAPRRCLYARPPEDASRWGWVAGTCLLMRRRALEEIGGFDEQYFLYAEDIDWCCRATSAGWEIWVDPAARCVHEGSAAVRSAGTWVDRHRHGSLDRWMSLHLTRPSLIASRVLRVLGPLLRALTGGFVGIVTNDADRRAVARRRLRDSTQMAALAVGRGPDLGSPGSSA